MAYKDPNTGWLERPATGDNIVRVLWGLCALAVIAELFYAGHPHFAWSGWFAAHAVFGFLAYCFVVFTAKGLRRLVARREDYYGDDEPLDDERPPSDER